MICVRCSVSFVAANGPVVQPKCSASQRIAGGLKALNGIADAATSFSLSGIHFFGAVTVVAAGCLNPTPFEPATCVGSGFAAVSLTGGPCWPV